MTDQKPIIRGATLTLHAGAGKRDIGAPASPPPVLATSYFTHPDAVGFSANDLGEAAPHFYTCLLLNTSTLAHQGRSGTSACA